MPDEYRDEFARFNEALAREHYLHYSGQKAVLNLEPIYDRYGYLFSREAIDRLMGERDRVPAHFETVRRGWDYLLTFAYEQQIELQVRHLTEQVAAAEVQATIRWDGEEITFYEATTRLATEPDPKRRRAVNRERLRVISRTNELRRERLVGLHRSAEALGFASYRDLYRRLRPYEMEPLLAQATALRHRTDEPYQAALRRALVEELGWPPEMADRADLGYFLHYDRYNDFFPRDGLRAAYRETFRALGIDCDRQKNIVIDDVERPGKHPRAFCAPIRVPEEIKLVVRPTGGQDDYQAFLHEGGHAQHFGWTAESLAPEFKYAGDRAVSETYAFLFHYLVGDRRWLDEIIRFARSDEFRQGLALRKLLSLRRYAAKFEYEWELHSGGDPDRAAESYARRLTDATGFRYGAEEYLSDLDDGFYSGDYLRAWAAEVILRDSLKTRYGHRWWKSRKAGEFLIELWQTGQQYTVDELIAHLGVRPLSFDPLVDELLDLVRGK
jgi:hypothetical protein